MEHYWCFTALALVHRKNEGKLLRNQVTKLGMVGLTQPAMVLKPEVSRAQVLTIFNIVKDPRSKNPMSRRT